MRTWAYTEKQVRQLEKLAARVLQKMKIKNSAAEIFLVSNRAMRKLEKTYMGRVKKVVDVLSFPEPKGFPRPDSRRKILGQIYLNADLLKNDPARRDALLIHGLLHLLGYSHSKKSDRMKMEKLEQRLYTHLCHHVSSPD